MYQTTKKERPKIPEDNRIHEKKSVKQIKNVNLNDIMNTISERCGDTILTTYGNKCPKDNDDIVIFLPMADKEFKSMVYWDECHPINRDEQLYEGIGHIFRDGRRRIVVISHFLYIYAAERTPTSACIMNGTYNSVMSRIEYEIEIYKRNEMKCNIRKDGSVFNPFVGADNPSEPVLYGHTHPNLGCFFSPPDRVSGFATDDFPAVTFVADPIRKEMKAGVGVELNDAQILVYSYDDKKENEKNVTSKEKQKRFLIRESKVVAPLDRSTQPIKANELISEISRDCSELMNPSYGAKGKFTSRTTITGAQKIKMEMTWKPEKKDVKKSAVDTRVVGKTYDSYA